jgi:PAS domain S-box-containing protein
VAHRFALSTHVEHVFAEMAAAVGVGLYVYQVDDASDPGSLRLVFANPASATATGVEVAEVLGKPIREAFPGLVETPLPGIYLAIALGGGALSLGDVEYADERVAAQVFSVHAFPLPDRCVGVSFTNLTAQRMAEHQAVQTLESMSDAFFTVDSDWRFTYLNPQSEPILDRRREDLIGKSMWDEFPEGVGSRFYDGYLRAVRDRVTVQIEERYEPLGRVLQVRAYPIANGMAAYYRDVTSERHVEAQLRQAQRLEAIGRVTAGVAHDFNNLLTAIRGFANLGEAGSGDAEKAARYFAAIDAAGQKAAQLTRQLLAVGRQQELAPAHADLNEVVLQYASLLRSVLPPDVELSLELSPEQVPVFVDRAQLEQVILNLTLNARDAIEQVGTITIRTSADPPPGLAHDTVDDSAWLQVVDTGSGIPEDVEPNIFEPFFSTKPAEVGTGLGLATIYGIVSQSGGDIYVETAVGEGTSMTVVLPTHGAATPLPVQITNGSQPARL